MQTVLAEILKYLPLTKTVSCGYIKNFPISISSLKPNYIVFSGKKIEWEHFKSLFKKGKIDEKLMRIIGCLRRMTILYLRSKLQIIENCYVEIGSDTPTSDLDFTYVAYSNPKSVVTRMIKFYNLFYSMYGNYPDITFDTNYYITSTILDKNCYKTITSKPILRLFTPSHI